jgi:hypothetical protein
LFFVTHDINPSILPLDFTRRVRRFEVEISFIKNRNLNTPMKRNTPHAEIVREPSNQASFAGANELPQELTDSMRPWLESASNHVVFRRTISFSDHRITAPDRIWHRQRESSQKLRTNVRQNKHVRNLTEPFQAMGEAVSANGLRETYQIGKAI